MKAARTWVGVAAALLVALGAHADPVRQNVLWARSTNGAAITLDGILNEPAWASAESRVIKYGRGVDNGIPGSGQKVETITKFADTTFATIKFLTVGNQLYMAAVVKDSSVGGSNEFNRFDGLLMSIKDHGSTGHPKPPAEYFYSWFYQNDPGTGLPPVPNPTAKDLPPAFGGRWATAPWGSPRTQQQIDAWNAVTVVNGHSNSDTLVDNGYTVEMRFDLTPMGYHMTDPGGDVVEFNISIYDCDWNWPFAPARFHSERTWWQSPWGNQMWYDEVRLYARPDVTVASGAVPTIGPELRIKNGSAATTPVIDGFLTDAVWSIAPSLQIKYGDNTIRDAYGEVLKDRAGEYQPPVNGDQEGSLPDRSLATVKYFFKGNFLYLGFDVNDESVTSIPVTSTPGQGGPSAPDRWDGFLVSLNDRLIRSDDANLKGRRLAFRVSPTGAVVKEDWTVVLIDSLAGGQLALKLKPNTTVDTTGLDFDEGYTAEFAIDLTKIGYPSGLGDGALFMGINFFDNDCYTPYTSSYATRTWWGREYEDQCCPISAYLDPNLQVTAVEDGTSRPSDFALLGNFPNPFTRATAIRFTMATRSQARLDIFDLQGRLVRSKELGVLTPGTHDATIDQRRLEPGVYLYRLQMRDPVSGASRADLSGKMMLVR